MAAVAPSNIVSQISILAINLSQTFKSTRKTAMEKMSRNWIIRNWMVKLTRELGKGRFLILLHDGLFRLLIVEGQRLFRMSILRFQRLRFDVLVVTARESKRTT